MERWLTEEPMTFTKITDRSKKVTKGIGYVLWEKFAGRDERYSSSRDCETQKEADEWGRNMVEIYECPRTPRLQAIYDKQVERKKAKEARKNARKELKNEG